MKREEFEKYLGKMVEIKLFDGEIIKGCLRKSGDEIFKNNPNLYIPQKLYFVTANSKSLDSESCLFRVSHVKRIRECR